MWNDSSCYKRITFNVVFFFVIICSGCFFVQSNIHIAYAEDQGIENEVNENISNIIDGIDSDEIDQFLPNDLGLEYFEIFSFKDLVMKILSGEYFVEYDSFFEFFKTNFLDCLKSVFGFVLSIFAMIVLYEIFASLCIDKYLEFKKSIKFIFSLIIALSLMTLSKNIGVSLKEIINKLFSFSNILFPILLSLVLSSGAVGGFSIYSSLSVFVLNSGLYVFLYLLLPLAVSILIISIFSIIDDNGKLLKINNLLKYIFKMIIGIMFAIFGIFSTINIISSSMKDGLSFKLTKYAIKNYIPILGGYISEGFDFVKVCSILVKNAFGICGIIFLLFVILKPLILYFVYIFSFKVLSVLSSLVGDKSYSGLFEEISKSFSYIMAVLIGVFLIMFIFIFLLIISVSVV